MTSDGMEITIATKLGPVVVYPMQRPVRVASVDLGYVNGTRAWEPLRVRGRGYMITSWYFDRDPDTRAWTLSDKHCTYRPIQRLDDESHATGSQVTAPTVVRAISEAVIAALTGHITDEMMTEAEERSLQAELAKARETYSEARKAFTAAEDRINALRLLLAIYGDNDAPTELLPIVVYHRTTTEAATAIRETGNWLCKENPNYVYVSNLRQGEAIGYGDAIVTLVGVPEHLLELDDEFPDGEIHYRIKADDIKPEWILRDE